MLKKSIYLDYAAGTPVSKKVLKTSLKVAQKFYGNPSALHAPGVAAIDLLTQIRTSIAKILAVKADHLIFTAGATEANNLIALSLRKTYPQARLACLNIDHDSYRLNADYYLKVDLTSAQITSAQISKIPPDVCCLSLAGINNELGVIQPFALIKQSLKELREQRLKSGNKLPLILHIDASQMALTHSLQPQSLAAADLLTINGAKFYAFKQSGLIYKNPNLNLKAPFKGGEQEQAWRPGSESLLLASGLKTALQEVESQKTIQVKRLKNLQSNFENQLQALGGEVVLKHSSARSPHLTVAIFKDYDNETLALKLSNLGIHVGIGSACHSRSDLLESSALRALGYRSEQIYAALRFSFAYETTKEELDFVLKSLSKLLNAKNQNEK